MEIKFGANQVPLTWNLKKKHGHVENAFSHSLSLLKVVQRLQLGRTEGEDFTISSETGGEQKDLI